MTGFCDYGDSSTWMDLYDPVHDGFAAQAGVKSGDIIRGIEVFVTRPLYFILLPKGSYMPLSFSEIIDN